jgi:hypothetical protein
VGAFHLPLLVLGYAAGVAVYAAVALALLRGARDAGRRLVALYWRDRSRRETVATVRRLHELQEAPPRRRAA